ncbi:MAG TPA: PstS family phosphate ABC transporter substrate-binding protein [Alphaproteobacteria bacterium]
MKKTLLLAAIGVAALAGQAYAQSRDQIRIVGSSTVYPFTTTVAERFAKAGKFKAPVVESTGTGGGMKLFCAGVGTQHPDLTNASRRMKKSEFDQCAKNGVKDIYEIKVGFDGIAIAQAKSGPKFNLTLAQIWLALAKEVPEGNKDGGKLVANPNKTWKDVDPSFPAVKIEVLGPPPTSGTRDSFVELAMEAGCDTFASVKALAKTDAKKHKAACQTMREDGAFIEAGENDNVIVQKLVANPNALGIFGFSFLDQNKDKLNGHTVNGVQPTFETISSGKYPIARDMFVYVKKAHMGVVPGIKEFVAEYTSARAMGKRGYLVGKGLVPLPDAEFKKVNESAKAMTNLSM